MSAVPMSEHAVLAHARSALQQGSRSFAVASRLLPPGVRDDAMLLYAWCRHCDDVVDGQALGHGLAPLQGEGADAALAALYAQTEAVYTDAALTEPAFLALRAVVRRHDLPRQYPFDHLAGFRMDVDGTRYVTPEDTLRYCYHVAGVVGTMMATIMGVRDPAVLARACDLGIGFQLTNIARDVIEDAQGGRVYLPAQWLREAGVDPDRVDDPASRQAVHAVAVRLLALAEPYYASADTGIAALPARCAMAIATARRVYHAIGVAVRQRGAAAWDGRVSTTRAQKLGHVWGAMRQVWIPRARQAAPRPPAPWEQRG